MPWPLSQDYNESVQNPRHCFTDPELQQGEAVTNALGLPMPRSGNFADVYEVICPKNKTRWAVKCFTREVPGLRERYSEISNHLRQARLPFTVDFTYQADGIKVQSKWFPILKMQWVEGQLLNECVRNNLTKPATLDGLVQIWARMARRLREADVAHCDLQHGNVLLVPGSKPGTLAVKLIDYDGMFVPALAKTRSGEVGHPAFQHPQRLKEGTYNLQVDRFPLLVVASAFRCLKVGGKSLWERFDNGDNLLFREADFRNPVGSALLKELWQLDDSVAHALIGYLTLATQGRLEQTPLVDQLLEEGTTPALTPAQEKQVSGLLGERRAARASVALTATPGATVPVATVLSSEFDFGAGQAPAGPNPFRKRSRSVPLWVWAAGGVAVAAVALVVFLAMGKKDPPSGNKDRIAQTNDRAAEPSKLPEAKATTVPEKTPGDTNADNQPAKKQPEPKNSSIPPVTKQPEPADVKPMPPPAVVKQQPDAALPDGVGEVRRFEGHTQQVNGVAFSPDGRFILSVGSDRIGVLWEIASGKEVRRFEGPTDRIEKVAFSPDGRHAVVASLDHTARLWEVATGKELRAFRGHQDWVRGVTFSPSGSYVLTSSGGGGQGDNTLRLWDVGTGQQIKVLSGHTGPVTAVLFCGDEAHALSSSDDSTLRYWDLLREMEVKSLKGHQGQVYSIGATPKSQIAVSGGDDGDVRVWSVHSGQPPLSLKGHKGFVASVAMSKSARHALSGGADKTVRLWDALGGKELARFEGHLDAVHCVAFSPDERFAVSGGLDKTVRLWRLPAGPGYAAAEPTKPAPAAPAKTDQAADLPPNPAISYRVAGRSNASMNTAFSPDCRRAFSSDGLEVMMWEVATGRELARFAGHEHLVGTIAVSADGHRALSGSKDKSARIWDVDTAKEVRRIAGLPTTAEAGAFSPDGGRVVIAGGEMKIENNRIVQVNGRIVYANTFARIYDVASGAEKCRLEGDIGLARAVFMPDGQRVLTGSTDGALRIWDAHNGRELDRAATLPKEINALTLAPDGRLALVASDMQVYLWNLQTRSEVKRLEGKILGIRALAFSPDGSRVLAAGGGSQDRKPVDTEVRCWDVQSGKRLGMSPPHPSAVTAVMFTPNGRAALSVDMERNVRSWDISGGNVAVKPAPASEDSLGLVRKYEGHGGPIRSVAVSADGKRVLTGAFSGELILWDMNSGAIVKQFEGHHNTVECVAFSPDGRYAASSASKDTGATVRVWDLQTLSSVRQFPIQLTKSIAFSRNSRWLAAGSATMQFGAWDLQSGVGQLHKNDTGQQVPQIWGLAFLADNRRVLLSCADKTLRIWDVTTMQETTRWEGHGALVTCVAVSPDGKKALSGSFDGTVKVWNLQNNRLLHTIALGSGPIHALAWTPDGHRALAGTTATQNAAVRIIDVDTGNVVRGFTDTGAAVEGLAVAPDGRHAFLASLDATLRRLTFATGPARTN